MAKFKRGMGQALLKSLSENSLFRDKLCPDIEDGQVFFTTRHKNASFYIKGSSLFTYEINGFSSHEKFAFILNRKKAPYITESELGALRPAVDFYSVYNEIKNRAQLYAKGEATGISALYKYAPHNGNKHERYFLVDIEDEMDAVSGDSGKKTDRADILLYDNENRELLFCEAKLFSNSELRAAEGELPKVITQLERYDKQIAVNDQTILEQYTIAFSDYNALMGTSLNPPEKIAKKCGLYIFGFTQDKLQKFKEIHGTAKCFYGRLCRTIGNTHEDSAMKLFKALT